MGYKHYTPEFKTQVVLEVLREEKALGEIAAARYSLVRSFRATEKATYTGR